MVPAVAETVGSSAGHFQCFSLETSGGVPGIEGSAPYQLVPRLW